MTRPCLAVFDLDGTLLDTIGDLAASCNEMLSLLAATRDRMSADTIRLLQAGEQDKLLFTLFHSLSDAERASFFRLTAIDLTYDDYETLALTEYGDAFTSYKNPSTLPPKRRCVPPASPTLSTRSHAIWQAFHPP